MQLIIGNWSSKFWEPHTYTQKDGKTNITTGANFNTKAVHFKCDEHKDSKELYPHKSNLWAVCTNLAYTALYFPMKGITAAGNIVVGIGNIPYGTYQTVRNFSNKEFSKREAFRPAWNNATQLLKDGAIALTAYAAYRGDLSLYWTSFSTVIYGYNIAQVAAIGALGLAVLHSVHNPKGFQRTIHHYLDRMDPTPLTDGEVYTVNFFQRVAAILDGRISLARTFSMHYMGKSDQKGKFEEIKKS